MTPQYAQLFTDHYDDDRHLECTDLVALAAEPLLMAYAKQLGSDGRLSRPQVRGRIASFPAFDSPGEVAGRLVAAHLAIDIDEKTIELVGWERWMKSKAELEAFREQQAKFGRLGGRPPKGDPSGEKGSEKGDPLPNERVPEGQPFDPESQQTRPDRTRPEVEDRPDLNGLCDNSEEDDGEQVVFSDPRMFAVVELLATRAADQAKNIATTRDRYIKGTMRTIVRERRDDIEEMLRAHPSSRVEHLVDLLDKAS